MYEILVPTVRDSERYYTRKYHRLWDTKVREISGGLTILKPVKGEWVSPEGSLFSERMIPVRISCTEDEMNKIADLTAKHYSQKCILFYRISDCVVFRCYQ